MAKTEVFTCDICKQSKSENDLARIKISVDGLHVNKGGMYGGISFDVCSDCLKKKGIIVDPKQIEENKEQTAITNDAKLTDALLDWLSDMGVQFQE